MVNVPASVTFETYRTVLLLKFKEYFMTSQPKNTDRRVLRTKKNIRQAFLQLLSEKPLPQLTVKELSDHFLYVLF